jgi:hypothetical protein
MNLKIRQEEIEVDYLDKLNDKEKAWLNQFNKEFVLASFKKEDKKDRLHPVVYVTKKVKTTGKKKKIDVYKKDCEDRNNSRNRDSYGITKINNMLKGEKGLIAVENNRSTNLHETENTLIEYLDQRESGSNTEKE